MSESDKQENQLESMENLQKTGTPKKKSRVTQNLLPVYSLEDSLAIPRAIKDNYAGQPTVPLLVAEACNISPTSTNWRYLSGASMAYGLTEGAYGSKEISITTLGERIVSPLKEGDDLLAMQEAILKPTILREIYTQYDQNKLPREDILRNVFEKKGVPTDRLDFAIKIFRENANKTNCLRNISGNEFIYLNASNSSASNFQGTEQKTDESYTETSIKDDIPAELLQKINVKPPELNEQKSQKTPDREKPRVFISHGKNNATIVGQLKELLSYGQMEPIVSIEREATAIPVPDKVFDDMRNCDAGIIHVDVEEIQLDDGNSYKRLNENVLIEIGAAIALYGKKVILLCKTGTILPSNLQGLYRCEYAENQLDYGATMKVLKTLQELRKLM